MTSMEALKEFYNRVTDEAFNKTKNLGEALEVIQQWEEKYRIIDKDLYRLEKCLKGLKIMWDKNVNIVYIKIFKYFEKYSEYYTGYSSKDKLTKEEFDLLKDVLENGL